MAVGKMPVSKMSVDKVTFDKMTFAKMSADKMAGDKMTIDKVSVGKRTVDEMSSRLQNWTTYILETEGGITFKNKKGLFSKKNSRKIVKKSKFLGPLACTTTLLHP